MLRCRSAAADRLPHSQMLLSRAGMYVSAASASPVMPVAASPSSSTLQRSTAAAYSSSSTSFYNTCHPPTTTQCHRCISTTTRPSSMRASSIAPSVSLGSLTTTPRRSFSSKTLDVKHRRTAARRLETLGFNPLGYKVAIIGRPNVGKSTLFNRLVGRAAALVDNRPGVTRDRREGDAALGELQFRLVDTAGLEEVQEFLSPRQAKSRPGATPSPSARQLDAELGEYRLLGSEPISRTLQQSIMAQTELAIREADVALFVIDGREGVTPLDRWFAQWLRRMVHQQNTPSAEVDPVTGAAVTPSKKPVVLVANKCDNSEQEHLYHGLVEGWELGFGEPVSLSADHAAGLGGLHNALYDAFLPLHPLKELAWAEREKALNAEVALLPSLRHIKLAIVGKVNTGKSSLVNTLLGKERVLTGAQPGVTRDAVEVEWRDATEEAREAEFERRKAEALQAEQDEMMRAQTTGRQRREMREAAQAAAEAEAANGASEASAASSSSSSALVPAVPAGPLAPTYRFTLVDTAGLKGVTVHAHSKYSRVDAMAMGATLKALDMSNVVALVVDVSDAGLEGVRPQAEQERAAFAQGVDGGHKHGAPAAPPTHSKSKGQQPQSDPKPIPLHSMLFKPGRVYSESERLALLNTFVRNILSAADLSIASRALREGRALLLLLNKFDLVPPGPLREQILEGVRSQLTFLLPEAGAGLPVLGISGFQSYDPLRGQLLKTTLRQEIIALHSRWESRIPTHKLNRWLGELLRFHPPPPVRRGGAGGKELQRTTLKFISQVSTGPPSFVLFSNTPASLLPDAFHAFLLSSLRREFGLQGLPVRLHVRVKKNPYLEKGAQEQAKQKNRLATAKQAAAAAAAEEADIAESIPAFSAEAEGESTSAAAAAAGEEHDEDEFNESDYADESEEVRFDYDAEDRASASQTAEGRAELVREREVKRAAAVQAVRTAVQVPPTADSPIPRVTDPRGIAAQRAAMQQQQQLLLRDRLPKVNTSDIFASTRTVASKPGRNLGVTASAKWSLGRPKLPGAASNGAGAAAQHQQNRKPFGTRRPKAKAPSFSGMQSASVMRSNAKQDEFIKKRKENTANKKAAARVRKQTAKSAAK